MERALAEEECEKLREQVEMMLKGLWDTEDVPHTEALRELWREYDRVTEGPVRGSITHVHTLWLSCA